MSNDSASSGNRKIAKKVPGRTRTIDSGPLKELLGFHLRLASLELRRNFNRDVGDGNVRPSLASLLLLVAANPGASQKSVSHAMHIDKTSLVPILNEAESAGWLQRVRSKADRRRHELRLTPLGQSAANRLRKQVLRHEQEYLQRFSTEEIDNLVDYLERIYK